MEVYQDQQGENGRRICLVKNTNLSSPLFALLTQVILKQLNVPQQREKVHLSEFQPIEKAVYDRHFKDIKPAVRSLVNTLSSSTYGKVQKEAASVANLISRLRTCCSHPSIGSHGMGMSNGGGGGKKKRSKDDGDR